ncbi:MAG TPA: hypothetical protein VKA76_11185, partial [Gammaproteobacteria bacterium]|nr:hypothetical protein [Gammaproteobacteria bacterium]
AQRNIGDPSEFLGEYSVEDEEGKVAEFMEREGEQNDLAELFAQFLDTQQAASAGPLENFIPDAAPTQSMTDVADEPFSLYGDDFHYAAAVVDWLRAGGVSMQAEVDRAARRLSLTAPPDLEQRLRHLPQEARPDDDRFILTPDVTRIQDELGRRRDEDSPWAQRQYLWPLHPVMEWLADRAHNAFGRHTAPVIRLPGQLAASETAFLIHGGFPNRRGYLLMQAWLGLVLRDGEVVQELPLAEFCQRLGLHPGELANRGVQGDTAALQAQLPGVVDLAMERLRSKKRDDEQIINERLNTQMAAMDTLKQRHVRWCWRASRAPYWRILPMTAFPMRSRRCSASPSTTAPPAGHCVPATDRASPAPPRRSCSRAERSASPTT